MSKPASRKRVRVPGMLAPADPKRAKLLDLPPVPRDNERDNVILLSDGDRYLWECLSAIRDNQSVLFDRQEAVLGKTKDLIVVMNKGMRSKFDYGPFRGHFLAHLKVSFLDIYTNAVHSVLGKSGANAKGAWPVNLEDPSSLGEWPTQLLLSFKGTGFAKTNVASFLTARPEIPQTPAAGAQSTLKAKALEWLSSRKKEWKSAFSKVWYCCFADVPPHLQIGNDDDFDGGGNDPAFSTLLSGFDQGLLHVVDGAVVDRDAPEGWDSRDVEVSVVRDFFEAACFPVVDQLMDYFSPSEVMSSHVTSEFCRLLVNLRQAVLDDEEVDEHAALPSKCPDGFPSTLFTACVALSKKVQSA
jgi:hypothetical protein